MRFGSWTAERQSQDHGQSLALPGPQRRASRRWLGCCSPSLTGAARALGRSRHGRIPHRAPSAGRPRPDGIKGAPETFDAEGYLHLLRRIRTEAGPIYAPEFERDIEDSLAHVVEIRPEVGLVITEGNYLLLESKPWIRVRELLDEAWFVHLVDSERQRRWCSGTSTMGMIIGRRSSVHSATISGMPSSSTQLKIAPIYGSSRNSSPIPDSWRFVQVSGNM